MRLGMAPDWRLAHLDSLFCRAGASGFSQSKALSPIAGKGDGSALLIVLSMSGLLFCRLSGLTILSGLMSEWNVAGRPGDVWLMDGEQAMAEACFRCWRCNGRGCGVLSP
tara:strand:+ start:2035 stop:2364 length:330 start_codon:yes stop_codon:yes gene_type:complete